jgi:hypothetical protein
MNLNDPNARMSLITYIGIALSVLALVFTVI